jgi:molecular chaperone DnaK
MEKINAARQAASEDMYKAQQQAGGASYGNGSAGNPGAGFDPNNMGGNPTPGAGQQGNNPNNNVTDVDYEEVK